MQSRFMYSKQISVLLFFCWLFFIVSPVAAEPASPNMPVKKGMYGDEVSKLQNKLGGYGYYKGPVDGRFGANTLSAVIQFQMDSGLDADGVVGLSTWEALKISAAPVRLVVDVQIPANSNVAQYGPSISGGAVCVGRKVPQRLRLFRVYPFCV